jgi:hypothetical protein
VAFMTENGRPCDDLVEMKYTLLAHAENAQQNPSATAAPVAATAVPAAPVASGGARPCQIRLRLSDGSQVCDCGKMRVRNFAPLIGSVDVKVCLCCIPPLLMNPLFRPCPGKGLNTGVAARVPLRCTDFPFFFQEPWHRKTRALCCCVRHTNAISNFACL